MANQNKLITQVDFFSGTKFFYIYVIPYLEVAPVIVQRVTSIWNLRFVFDT